MFFLARVYFMGGAPQKGLHGTPHPSIVSGGSVNSFHKKEKPVESGRSTGRHVNTLEVLGHHFLVRLVSEFHHYFSRGENHLPKRVSPFFKMVATTSREYMSHTVDGRKPGFLKLHS